MSHHPIVAVQIVFADEYDDSIQDEFFMEIPEGMTDEEALSLSLHQDFRKAVLGEEFINDERYDYFSFWIDVRIKLNGTLSSGTLDEFYAKHREYMIETYGELDHWRKIKGLL